MEVEDEEAQICRLCGQCESIYIDVFGEEGTKRYLGLKIHAKINILIDEEDPLPKAICVQCLGKLEFVCDFHEKCLRTQQLLRERFNLPPLTNIDSEIKIEETTPSTSTNNNSTDKNLNPPVEEPAEEEEWRFPQEEVTLQNAAANSEELSKNESENSTESSTSREETNRQPTEVATGRQSVKSSDTNTTSTRWLRSRQNTENTPPDGNSQGVEKGNDSIANRLRSHHSNSETASNTYRSAEKSPREEQGETPTSRQKQNVIQISTSILNKVLGNVANSPEMEVSVKESMNSSGANEDISFTVELRKKQDSNVVTVLAKVFPDQGTCMVDSSIIGLLESHGGVEARDILDSLLNSKDDNLNKNGESVDAEKKSSMSKNPEELYTMDGEEVIVDDNVEHIFGDNQTGYACKLCRKVYERKDKCTVHVKTHLGIKQYVCIICKHKFVCKSDVMKHIRCSHTNPRPIQCPKCPKRFRSKFDLAEHDNVHKGVRPYQCSDCGQSYHHKVSLQMHIKSHLPPQNLACEYCGNVFPFRTRLLSHVASVHLKNRRNFRCHFCYNLYSSLTVLNEHIKTRHAATHTCEICGKTFKVASKYKAHVLQHTNPKPFVCNICNNRYASKAFLNEHLSKHEGLRKHVCQKCGASFAQASHLAAHKHVHGEKKHACPECGRKFNRRDNMKVHRKRHFDESKKLDSKKKTTGSESTHVAPNEK